MEPTIISDGAADSFRIYPDWKDMLVYDEGPGRVIRFDCGAVGQTFYVSVPDADRWPRETPPWAHDRRPLIVGRLRAADCVLCEIGPFVSSTFSPDGLIRVEQHQEPDPPFRPRFEVRVVMIADGRVLASIPLAQLRGSISFPAPGRVTIPFIMPDGQHQLEIDVNIGTFSFDPNDRPDSLNELPAAVAAMIPVSRIPYSNAKTKTRVSAIFWLLVALMAVATGIWMLNTTNTYAYSSNSAIEADVSGILANVQVVAYTSTETYIKTTGLPSYSLGPFPTDPNTPTNQNRTFEITRTPTVNTGTKTATALGAIGVAVNGVAFFNAWDGMTSSYEMKTYTNGVRPNGGPTTAADADGSYLQDFQYVAGYGTLDQYNGRFAVAPGYPDGTYGYYVTATYPYIIGPDYYGNVDANDLVGGTITVPIGVTYYTGASVPEPGS